MSTWDSDADGGEQFPRGFDDIADGVCIVDDGKIISANDRFVDMTEADSRSEVVGRDAMDFVPEDIRARVRLSFNQLTEERSPIKQHDGKLATVTGDVIDVDVTAAPVTIQDGSAFQVILAEQQNGSAATDPEGPAETDLGGVLDRSNDAIMIIDPVEPAIREVNARAAEMLGYSRSELRGLDPAKIHPDEIDRWRRFVEETTEVGQGWTDELSCRTKDGRNIPAEISTSVVRQDDEGLILAVVRDLSRRRTEISQLTLKNRRFDAIFDMPSGVFALLEPDGRVIRMNEAALEMVDASNEDVRGKPFPETAWWSHSPELKADLRDRLERAADGETARLQATHLDKDGESRILEGVFQPVMDESGEVIEIVGIARDITERVQYRNELEWKTRAIETAPIGVLITDPDREDNPIIYANEGATEITGYTKAELEGRNCRFLQGEATKPEPVAEMREAMGEERPVTVELRNYRKSGSLFWNRLTIAPVEEADGSVSHFVGFLEDITDRKEYEQEIELFRSAVEEAGHMVMITDVEGVIEYVNPRFEEVTGYSAAEAIGSTPQLLKSGKHDESFYEEMWETILDGAVWESSIVNQRKNGELYQVEQTIAPIRNDEGEITQFIAMELEVTDERRRQERLDVLNRIFRHNIRNGMNVIMGNASHVKSHVDDEDLKAALESIETRAAKLVDIGEKAEETRRLVTEPLGTDQSVDVRAILADVVAEMEAAHPSADIETTITGPVHLNADERVQLAIREAIENAIVHNGQSTPHVEIVVTQSDQSDRTEMVEIEIADDGPGIPEDQGRVLEMGHETSLHHGTGIGLWQIKWVVSNFGGEVSVRENTPSGSIVSLRLPGEPG